MNWARCGSQLQVQLYVTEHPRDLSVAVLDQVPELSERAAGIEWVAPLPPSFHEPRDAEFLRAVGLHHLASDLRAFWPARGPVWDALAIVRVRGGSQGVLLCEGKSHPAEIYGSGTKAGPASRLRIAEALGATQRWLGVREDPERWMDPLRPEELGHSSLYQSANRYAHLYWLRHLHGVEAWLVHLLFVDDPTYRPTPWNVWEPEIERIEAELGLTGAVPHASHVYLPGLPAPSVPTL